MKVGVGLIGCGEIAAFHAEALQRSGKARVVATFDRQPERAQSLASRTGAKAVSHMEDLLADPSVGAVYVLTRHDSHAQIILQSIAAGKRVFCEKPLALSMEDARSVVQAAQKAAASIMVGFNYRWVPAVRLTRAWARERGTPMRSLQLTFATSPFLEAWPGLPEEGGGVMPCLGSHAMDLACFLVDQRPVRISAFSARLRLPDPYLPDTGAVLMQMEGGTLCSLTFHDHAPITYTRYGTGERSHLVRAEVYGEGWAAIIDDIQQVRFFDESGRRLNANQSKDPLVTLGILGENEHFIHCLLSDEKPVPNEEDGAKIVQLVSLASLSARTGATQRVNPGYFSDSAYPVGSTWNGKLPGTTRRNTSEGR